MRFLGFSAALCAAAAAAAASPTPLARYGAGGDAFIDDGFALREDGKALAYISTDGATRATLHLVDIGGTETKIEHAPVDAVSIHWLQPTRILIVRGREGSSTAQVFGATGPTSPPIGPFGQLAVGTLDGRASIITYTRSEKRGVEHVLVAYAIDTLRAIKRRTWREDGEGQIRLGSASLKPLWWSDGFTVLAALRAGEYDKARDLRRPDRYTRVDVFSGRVIEETEVEDVLGFARIMTAQRSWSNQPVIAQISDDHRQLVLIDGLRTHELALPRELWKYDATSLVWQLVDGQHVLLSLTVDPVNADAVNRKKADVDDIDFYAHDRQTHAIKLILRLPGEGRRSRWQVADHRLLLLRKSKGFDRGGVVLELYDIGDSARADH